jgi:predicted dehydrogenase
MSTIRLITYDPGHFHAALVQKEMYPGVDPTVHVYAPLGADLAGHVARIAGFNTRAENPTWWDLEVHACREPLARLVSEKPGTVVVFSGRNRGKIDAIKAVVEAGLNVLADKPWVVDASDLPKLQSALETAEAKGLVAYDIMTERFEITSILQQELVGTPEVFGDMQAGTPEEPGVSMESIHYLMKMVAGVPNRRPAWFFDITQQGEGLTDVGTHLVDLVMWVLYPGQGIDHRGEVQVLAAKRWPTKMTREEYQQVTGEADFSENLRDHVGAEGLSYFCNTQVSYTVRGVHVKLDVLWDYQAQAGAGDSHNAIFRGSRASVAIRQGKEENYRPELYVVPVGDKAQVAAALASKVQALQGKYPGVAMEDRGAELRVTIPDVYRVGHEAHFAEVTRQFLKYLADPKSLPAWENINMLAKYHTTTQGVALARQG